MSISNSAHWLGAIDPQIVEVAVPLGNALCIKSFTCPLKTVLSAPDSFHLKRLSSSSAVQESNSKLIVILIYNILNKPSYGVLGSAWVAW